MSTVRARLGILCAVISLVITGCSSKNDPIATGVVTGKDGVIAGNCASLMNLKMMDTTITSATSVTPPFTPPGGGAAITTPFCRIVGVSSPTSDSVINYEVWLPAAASWNSKFYSGTGGGSTGAIQYGSLRIGLAAGYAAKSQDRGHISRADLGVPASTDGSWAAGHPEKVIDWGYRSEHVTTVAAKGIIEAYYASAPKHSYFVGCSAGGHIGVTEATRFPEDYDGIVASAPAWDWTHLLAGRLWSSLPSLRDPSAALTAPKLAVLNNAVVAACDATDGLVDGLIGDPRKCTFDPAVLQCTGADAANCLTAAQVQTAKTIYAGPRRANGTQIFPGYPFGSELLWTVNTGPTPGGSSFDFFRYWVFENANYDSKTFNFNSDMDFTDNKMVAGETMASVVNATPNLSAFSARGGKLLIWHGWADEQVHTMSSIDFYNKIVASSSKAQTDSVMRLFLAPGMAHCGGGPGPNTLDALTPLEQWVEKGIAPSRIIATKAATAGVAARTRPLCAYPQVAKYNGSGDINDAANFTCADPT